MLAHYRAGRVDEALAVYREARRHLAEELGLDPGPELQELHRRILGGDVPATAGPVLSDGSVAPAQLPADLAGFAGRDRYLRQLDALLAETDAESGTAAVISAIGGTAGVGKTALAVHWAHRVRQQFPDGQLYLNLRGFDPVGRGTAAPARRAAGPVRAGRSGTAGRAVASAATADAAAPAAAGARSRPWAATG
jgi:hypothetical protein